MNTLETYKLRNDDDFSFIGNLKNYIVNDNFEKSYFNNSDENGELCSLNKSSYIWYTLSSIGEDFGKVIYSDVINYIDLVSNIDICKTKSLKSMFSMLGINYSIFNDIENIPVEIINIIDGMSINKKYLLNKNVINSKIIKEFINNDIVRETELSNVSPNSVFDFEKYREYLNTTYYNILTSNICLKYDDYDKSETQPYIYQYLSNDFIDKSDGSVNIPTTSTYDEFTAFKIKYNIDSSFNQSDIVDNINLGQDSLDNYSGFEKELLEMEISYRAKPFDISKPWTKYKYYKEQQVKKYINFVENQMFNENVSFSNELYKLNEQYIELENSKKSYLVKHYKTNSTTNTYKVYLDFDMISFVAKYLTDITINISEIREKAKSIAQQNYIKGTFNLLSFFINEYLINFSKLDTLKNEILSHYTEEELSSSSELSAELTTAFEKLDNIMSNLSKHSIDDINIIEYYDTTEYFNIKTDKSSMSINSNLVNDRFWEQGKTTNRFSYIPSEEIESYYKNVLSLKPDVTDLDDFLRTIYNIGADNTYKDSSSGKVISETANNYENVYKNYIGTEDGVLNFNNIKNLTHPSYQVHPYLYNLIEVGNFQFPIKNAYYNENNETMEDLIVMENLSDFIGEFGEILTSYKNGIFDYSGYKSSYELNLEENKLLGFEGTFYKDAINELFSNESSLSSECIDSIRNKKLYNNSGNPTFYKKYYSHLNMTNDECEDIANKLSIYIDNIKEIVETENYDVYKYLKDRFNNSYILFKQYNNNSDILYNPYTKTRDILLNTTINYDGLDLRENSEKYFKERENTCGEVWIRLENHPIAFPAFYGDSPVIDIRVENINGRFSNLSEDKDMKIDRYHMRYFYDMEIFPSSTSIYFLTCPIFDAVKFTREVDRQELKNNIDKYQRIEKTDIIISNIKTEFDYSLNRNILQLTSDKDVGVDSIDNTGILEDENETFFKGIYFNDNIFNCIFLKKQNITTNVITFDIYEYIESSLYNENRNIILDINRLLYNNNLTISYDNTFYINNFKISYTDGRLVFILLADYANDLTLRNYITSTTTNIIENQNEYTNIDKGISSSYNIFDKHIIFIEVSYSSNVFNVKNFKMYNIHADASYNSSFPGIKGKNSFYNHPYLKEKDYFNIQLLGYNQINIQTYIDYICSLYNITEDDTENLYSGFDYDKDTLSSLVWGRVFEDHDESKDESFNTLYSPLLNINCSTENIKYIKGSGTINSKIVWKQKINNFVNGKDWFTKVQSDTDLSQLNLIVYNTKTYGKNAYYIGNITKLSTYDEKRTNYDDISYITYNDINDINISEISSKLDETITVAGTYNYFNRELNKSEINYLNGVENINITYELKESNEEGKYKDIYVVTEFILEHGVDDITSENYKVFYIPENIVAITIYNLYDLRMYDAYHFLDTNAIIKNGAYTANNGELIYLSTINLVDYDYLSCVPALSGFNGKDNLDFKMDSGVSPKENNSQFYKNILGGSILSTNFQTYIPGYTGDNDRFGYYGYPYRPMHIIDSIRNSNNIQMNKDLLSNIWNDNDLFINQITDGNKIDNLGDLDFDIILENTRENSFRAYENYNQSEYDSSDPRVFKYIKFYENNIKNTEIPEFEIDDQYIIDNIINSNESINNFIEYLNYVNENLISSYGSRTSQIYLYNTESSDYVYENDRHINYRPDYYNEYYVELSSPNEVNQYDINKFFNIYVSYEKYSDGTIVLYFNYNNFINSPFIKLYKDTNKVSIDIIKGTYLKLKPGEDGLLDIVLQFKKYNKMTSDIEAFSTVKVCSYRIYNLSDDKPKFLIYNQH